VYVTGEQHVAAAAFSVAAGRFGAAVQQGGKLWDYAPLSAIVEEAGGVMTDLDGRWSRADGYGGVTERSDG
jgi:fructose-1,6-bisphosphatase/inositol monophosphatase family enzyme